MKEFNLEEAINGKAFYLKNGYRGVIKYCVDDRLTSEDKAPRFAYIGYVLDNRGFLNLSKAAWDENGITNEPRSYDAVGMVEDMLEQNAEEKMKMNELFNLEAALAGKPVMLRNGVFGKGVQDIPNAQRDPIYRKAYSRWHNLLQRCYSPEFKKKNPTYTRSRMCDEWLTFSKFYDWLVSFDNWENLEIDKDLLSGCFYSPETCLLIPKKLNCFLTFSQSTNTSMIGVNYYTPKGQKQGVFRATISMKRYGKTYNKHLGHFNTPLEGHLAWLEAKINQLDEHIESSFGKLKEILEKLKTYMLACLNNKQEFEGLNSFRESLSIAMWEEPKINIEDLPKPFKPEENELYFYIGNGCVCRSIYFGGFDSHLAKNGQCFRTREDAQKWLDFMKSMLE